MAELSLLQTSVELIVDNPNLKYCWLNDFDKAMISSTKEHHILEDENPYNMWGTSAG